MSSFTKHSFAQQVQEMITLIHDATKYEILPRWQEVAPEEKTSFIGFRDLVTIADKETSRYILERIRPKLPGSYSEEHKYADRFNHDLLWQIDPIDGTQEFCEGYAEGYTTLAGLLKRREDGSYSSVAGIINRPALKTVWYTDGSGEVVFLRDGNKQPLPTYECKEILVYQRKVDNLVGITEFLPVLRNHFCLPARIIQAGGSGASITDLLEGKINLIIFNANISKDWDVGMADPIIKALGGFICDLDGNELTYNRPDVASLGEPYNLRGYVISIVFKKEEILPLIKQDLAFDDRLNSK